MSAHPAPRTVVDALASLEDCTRHGVRFVTRSGEASFHPYREVLARARRAAGALQASGLRRGDRVAIVLTTSIGFFDVYLGTQLAGGIPAALYPPLRLGRLDEYFLRTTRMLDRIAARYLVTDRRLRQILGRAVAGARSLRHVLDVDDLGPAAPWRPVAVDPHDPALLQFSSGTTVEPKAVTLTHANLLANLSMIGSFFGSLSPAELEQGGVCWLPLYHDMGLLGNMYMGLHHPGTVTYLSPDHFIARPAAWLQTLSRFKGVISAAPDFAYGLCVSKVKDRDLEGVDLSHWKIAFNGAEPIRPEGLREFAERFAPWGFRAEALTPVYGLAEAGLAVTFSDPQAPPLVSEFDRRLLSERGRAVPGPGRRLASVGRAVPGLEVTVRDERGRQAPEGHVGRIVVRGPSVTPGYFNDKELSRRAIRGGWLDTGDLGFFHGGDLYVAGRLKDLVIIRGRNFAPQEIERLLDGLAGLRLGCCAAVSHAAEEGAGERLVILAERDRARPRPDPELGAEIRDRVLAGLGLAAHVELLEPGTLPRTSSGKMRRGDALRLYLAGDLRPPAPTGPLHMAREVGRSRLAWARLWLRRAVRSAVRPEAQRP
jgi:acyl-CoA synthetase (AMP-forming)/AMP-acid ligase II